MFCVTFKINFSQNRIEWSGKSIDIFCIAWENWANVWIDLHCLGQCYRSDKYFTCPIDNHLKLFNFGFGQWVVLPDIPHLVSGLLLYDDHRLVKTACLDYHVNIYLRLPVNLKTWSGYCIGFVIESISAYAACISTGPYVCILIGSCWILAAMVKEITSDLLELNVTTSSKRNHSEVQCQFCTISKRFSDTKQFSGI